VRTRENRAIEIVLRAVPSDFESVVQAETLRIMRGADSWLFDPIWIGEGLPADVRRARNMVSHGEEAWARRGIPILTARRMSPGAREILNDERLSWADASGRAQISVPGELYITRLDPVPADAGRPFKWSGAANAIAETLLTWAAQRPPEQRSYIDRVATIAEAADVSLPHAARVLRHFDEQRYTAKSGAERGSTALREFRDPGRMLSDWAGNYATNGSGAIAEFHVPWREHDRSLSMIATALAGSEWALTGIAAADLTAPYLTSIPVVEVYVPSHGAHWARNQLLSQEGVREVERGGRLRLLTEESYLFNLKRELAGLSLASPVRVYGDLLRQGGRAAEAAEVLRESSIGF